MLRSRFYEAQRSLLKLSGNRRETPAKDNSHISTSHIYIIRNEPLEPYLAHAITCASSIGVDLNLSYSEYDDSLAFTRIPEDSDYTVLWLNWERIPQSVIDRFFSVDSPISTWAKDLKMFFVLPSDIGTHSVSDFESALEKLGWSRDRFIRGVNSISLENRRVKLGYTREELDSISSKIGLQVPSNESSIKIRAFILDLDNTMYRGIFGEDSFADILIEPAHLQLHSELKRLKKSGVVLCIASKNNIEDMDTIFKLNLLTVLDKDDFAVISGGWESKAASVEKILGDLNFDERYVAFIDDNKRELYEVGNSFPNMICIDGLEPDSVLATLSTVLSFEESSNSDLVAQRNADIRSSHIRSRMSKEKVESESLLLELKTSIKTKLASDSEELNRAADLFRKTNQFNLTLKRTTIEELNSLHSSSRVVIASLEDTISDSGSIAALYYSSHETSVEILEFTISCRALGRDAEKYILRSMLEATTLDYLNHQIFVNFSAGPKNQPAFQFIERFFLEGLTGYFLDANKLISETSRWYGDLCES
jgi:FkbH-like protein